MPDLSPSPRAKSTNGMRNGFPAGWSSTSVQNLFSARLIQLTQPGMGSVTSA